MLVERIAACLALLAVLNLWNTYPCVDAQDRAVDEMSHLTPTPPAAENVDCHVYVRRVDEVAGRCITLGGPSGMYACQAGGNLDPFSPQCNGRRARRQRNHQRRWHINRPRH